MLECLGDLEPEVKTRAMLHDLADLLVKLSFFFPVVGGNSFKEGSLFRFHADEAKFHDSDSKAKPKSFITGTRPSSDVPKSSKLSTSPIKE